MKKVLAILLCAVMTLSLVACGKDNETLNSTNDVTFDRAETTDDVKCPRRKLRAKFIILMNDPMTAAKHRSNLIWILRKKD